MLDAWSRRRKAGAFGGVVFVGIALWRLRDSWDTLVGLIDWGRRGGWWMWQNLEDDLDAQLLLAAQRIRNVAASAAQRAFRGRHRCALALDRLP